jgi:hypothetical protein
MHQSRSKRLNEECGWKRGTGRQQKRFIQGAQKKLAPTGSLMEVDFVAVKAASFNSSQH